MERGLPHNLVVSAGRERRVWLERLPRLVDAMADRWSLVVGDPFQPGGETAWVAPARARSGESLVLKLTWRHSEALHEAEALRLWDGDGAVRLRASAALEDALALLVERCRPGDALRTRPEPEQDRVIAALLRRLWRDPPPGGPFRPLRAMCEEWADHFEASATAGAALGDAGLARAGIALLRSRPASAPRSVLLCTDLHAGNVLAAEREPWLAIDPKPFVGDPTYDALQHMLNCEARLRAAPRPFARRVARRMGLDADRLLLWLFARLVVESSRRPAFVDVARALAPP